MLPPSLIEGTLATIYFEVGHFLRTGNLGFIAFCLVVLTAFQVKLYKEFSTLGDEENNENSNNVN